VALPGAAAVVACLLDRAGVRLGGYVCAAGAWLAIAALLLAWLPVRAVSEASAGSLGAGIQLGLRLHAVSFAYEPFVQVPSVLVQGSSGTSVYAAIPISGLTAPVFIQLAAAAILSSGVVPCRSWAAVAWSLSSMPRAGLAVAAMVPLGFYLLTRRYSVGAGRY